MNKLNFSDKKTLKLTNVLKYKLLLSDDNLDFHTEIEKNVILYKGKRCQSNRTTHSIYKYICK